MKLIVAIMIGLVAFNSAANQNSNASNSLNTPELTKIKKHYETCVFEKGKLILKNANFRDAMEFAPLACRKELLQAKNTF